MINKDLYFLYLIYKIIFNIWSNIPIREINLIIVGKKNIRSIFVPLDLHCRFDVHAV